MLQSHVIEFRGIFAGAAVRTATSFRFVAVLPFLADLHETEWVSLPDVQRAIASRLRLMPTSP